ncbi:diacylglycerol kinase family lipid kinase [soil metagenome]
MAAVDTRTAGPFAGRTLIIVNPFAGHDDAMRVRRRLGAAFAGRDMPFDIAQTECAGHATELARTAVERGYARVAVCGGDGTLAEAATGLAGTTTPLGLIPLGTANQVAQNLGIPLDLDDAVHVIAVGHTTTIDVGRIDDRIFALCAGAGFDAAVMQSATRELKERWGFGAYVYAAMKEALAAAPCRFRIVADDRELEVDAVSVLVANVGELFTGWLPFRLPLAPQPGSGWNDGLFDVVIVAPQRVPDLAAILWHAAQRRFTNSDVLVHFEAARTSVDAAPPIAVQVDGDPAGTTPISMHVMREALSVIVPAPAATSLRA